MLFALFSGKVLIVMVLSCWREWHLGDNFYKRDLTMVNSIRCELQIFGREYLAGVPFFKHFQKQVFQN